MTTPRLTARRRERTTDAAKLATHLNASILEIADTATDVDKGDLDRTLNALTALRNQLGNAEAQVEEHRQAILDAKRFNEAPEFDVVPEGS